MKKKQWIFLSIWFASYITAMQFLRFKFGAFEITGAFILIGILLQLIFPN